MSDPLRTYHCLSTFQVIPLSNFTSNEACSVCRTSFHDHSVESRQILNEEILCLFTLFPGFISCPLPLDRPARLPCQANHVFGLVSLKQDFEAGNQLYSRCPLWREHVCPYTSQDQDPIQRLRFRKAANRIESLPLCQLVTEYRTWTIEHRVHIQELGPPSFLPPMISAANDCKDPRQPRNEFSSYN